MKIGHDARMARRFAEAVKAFAEAAQLVRGSRETAGLFQEAEKERRSAQAALDNLTGKNQEEEKRAARVRDLLKNGRAALNAGQFDNADRAFDEAARLAPKDPAVKQAERDLDQARKQALHFDLRIEPGQLTLPPGGRARVRIVVDRKGKQGPQAAIEVELRRLPGGVGASKATIPAGQNAAEVELGSAPSAKGIHRDIIAVGTVRGVNGQVTSPALTLNLQKK
jgi:tetratricopeptide (TPR) repeat protein